MRQRSPLSTIRPASTMSLVTSATSWMLSSVGLLSPACSAACSIGDLAAVTAVADEINTRPRKTLAWAAPRRPLSATTRDRVRASGSSPLSARW